MNKLIAFVVALVLTLAPSFIPVEHNHSHVALAKKQQAQEVKVYFNTHSLKYHDPDCTWAQRCTRNCILIVLSEAIRRGGIPCKVCGGG